MLNRTCGLHQHYLTKAPTPIHISTLLKSEYRLIGVQEKTSKMKGRSSLLHFPMVQSWPLQNDAKNLKNVVTEIQVTYNSLK